MNIEDIKNNLVLEIDKLVHIIKNEYSNLVDITLDYNLDNRVHIDNIGTISLFVKDKNFYFPLDAFKVLNILKKYRDLEL